MIALIYFVLGIDYIGYSAALSLFEDLVSIDMVGRVDVTFRIRGLYSDDDGYYFAVIGITGYAGIGVKLVSFGFFSYR